MGFDGVNHCHRLDEYLKDIGISFFHKVYKGLKRYLKIPFIIPYKKAIKHSVFEVDYLENVFPTMMPNWDHTPRSVYGGTVLHNSTPDLLKKNAEEVSSVTLNKQEENKIIFLKSWNEWGEGNYMEPDLKYGKGFIRALQKALEHHTNKQNLGK